MSTDAKTIQDLLGELDERTTAFLAELDALDDAQRGFRVEPGVWSMLDVGHHLMLVEKVVLQAARSGDAKGAKRSLRDRLLYPALKAVLKLGIRVKAPTRLVEPTDPITLEELKGRWLGVRAELKQHLAEIPEAELDAPLFRHVVAGPVDCRRGVEFLVVHFDHHLRQVARIKGNAAFPAAA